MHGVSRRRPTTSATAADMHCCCARCGGRIKAIAGQRSSSGAVHLSISVEGASLALERGVAGAGML